MDNSEQQKRDEQFMRRALDEALAAREAGEIPVGAVIVAADRIIARAHNLTETLGDVTAHAEMQAITSAANQLGGKYLTDCTLYVTVEPCIMCAGAIGWSQIRRVCLAQPTRNVALCGLLPRHYTLNVQLRRACWRRNAER